MNSQRNCRWNDEELVFMSVAASKSSTIPFNAVGTYSCGRANDSLKYGFPFPRKTEIIFYQLRLLQRAVLCSWRTLYRSARYCFSEIILSSIWRFRDTRWPSRTLAWKVNGSPNCPWKMVDIRASVNSREEIVQQSTWTHFKALRLYFHICVHIYFQDFSLHRVGREKAKVVFFPRMSHTQTYQPAAQKFFPWPRLQYVWSTIFDRRFFALSMKSTPRGGRTVSLKVR